MSTFILYQINCTVYYLILYHCIILVISCHYITLYHAIILHYMIPLALYRILIVILSLQIQDDYLRLHSASTGKIWTINSPAFALIISPVLGPIILIIPHPDHQGHMYSQQWVSLNRQLEVQVLGSDMLPRVCRTHVKSAQFV